MTPYLNLDNLPLNVILFGAGQGGLEAIEILNKHSINVIEIFDNDENKIGKNLIHGVKISKPRKTTNLVLISSIYAHDIAAQLCELECPYLYFGPCFERDEYFKEINRTHYSWMLENLSDDESKKTFISLYKFRKTANPLFIPKSNYDIYDHPCVHAKYGYNIIDGGAWIGDTAQFFLKRTNGECLIHCFEPSEESLKKINSENTIKIQKGLYKKDTILNLMLSSKTDSQNFILPFSKKKQPKKSVSVIKLDSYKKQIKSKIDLIKLDIEGSEISAIHGATELLKTDRPDLMIALYHRHNDLWEIPRLINTINPEYRFYLGHHSQYCFDTILYATADKR